MSFGTKESRLLIVSPSEVVMCKSVADAKEGVHNEVFASKPVAEFQSFRVEYSVETNLPTLQLPLMDILLKSHVLPSMFAFFT